MFYLDMNINELQSFCWTKMQAEGGESLLEILSRKEVERASGDGIFYWGVGNSLGKKSTALLSREVATVVFSRMLTLPKNNDVNPSAVSLWLNYKDLYGKVGVLPPHVVVTSRAYSNGGIKSRHYALVCRSSKPLQLGNFGSINTAKYRNYASDNPRIGHSQVTTIVEHQEVAEALSDLGRAYEVNLIAELAEPYFVTLMNPVVLSPTDVLELKSIFSGASDVKDYLQRINEFRSRVARDNE